MILEQKISINVAKEIKYLKTRWMVKGIQDGEKLIRKKHIYRNNLPIVTNTPVFESCVKFHSLEIKKIHFD